MAAQHSIETLHAHSPHRGHICPCTRTELRAGESVVICRDTGEAFHFSALPSLEGHCPYCRNPIELNEVFRIASEPPGKTPQPTKSKKRAPEYVAAPRRKNTRLAWILLAVTISLIFVSYIGVTVGYRHFFAQPTTILTTARQKPLHPSSSTPHIQPAVSPTAPLQPQPSATATIVREPPTATRPTKRDVEELPNLWNLMEYRDLAQPDTYTYYGTIHATEKWRWGFSWHAKDTATLQAILKPFSVEFYINDEPVSNTQFLVYDDVDRSGWVCRRWVTQLGQWSPSTTTKLEVRYHLETSIYDGAEYFAPGEYRQIIFVHVR